MTQDGATICNMKFAQKRGSQAKVSTATFYLPDTAKRSFPTRQQVIDWLEENYAYWPVKLMHGQTELTCQVKYLDSDSLDIWRAHQKEVDCDTRENLEKRHGKDTGASGEGTWSVSQSQ